MEHPTKEEALKELIHGKNPMGNGALISGSIFTGLSDNNFVHVWSNFNQGE